MDALDLAVIRGRLQQIAEEMDLVHVKAAFSPVVSEMADRANSIIDPIRIEVVTQGRTGHPMFVSTMQASARSIVEGIGSPLEDGDVIVMNVPFLGGTHLQDIKLLRPFFFDGELVLYLVNTGHFMDVGGASAAGFDPGATDIFQEGLQIPPTFLYRRGELRMDILRLLLQNTRLPEAQEGDFRAQINALEVGVRRLQDLVAERGVGQLREAVVELAQRSEMQMRNKLRIVPDGTYHGHDVVEISCDEELVIQVALRFRQGSVDVDFEGTSPSRIGPMNLARPTTETAVFLAFKHLFPEIPVNGGCFRPFTFRFPKGCFVAGEWPNAVGGYSESAQRVADAMFSALAQALPDIACGASYGTGGTLTFAGNREDGSFFAGMFPMAGGYGGSNGADGLVHGALPIGLSQFAKLEASEHDFPIRWDALEIRPDSAGPGKWRGGAGSVFRFRALVPMTVSFLGDRARHGPFGVVGGGEAARTEIAVMTRDGTAGGPGVSQLRSIRMQPGDCVEMKSAGGGGYGLVEERDAEARAADLRDGILTR